MAIRNSSIDLLLWYRGGNAWWLTAASGGIFTLSNSTNAQQDYCACSAYLCDLKAIFRRPYTPSAP
jgi:hypothetical protein